MFKKMPQTVAAVMATFHKQVEQLNNIIEVQERQRQVAEAEIAEAQHRRDAAESEMLQAVGARNRIKALLGDETPEAENLVQLNQVKKETA